MLLPTPTGENMTGPDSGPPFKARIVPAGRPRDLNADWVITGWQENGRYYLLASEDVAAATLTFSGQRHAWHFATTADLRASGLRIPRELNADIRAYTVIEADGYAECLAALLFGYQWKPGARALPAPGQETQT